MGYLIDEALAQFCFQERPRTKAGERGRTTLSYSSVEEPVVQDDSEDTAENQFCVLVAERTFLSSFRLCRDAHSVAQSTTEAVNSESRGYHSYHRGPNPRRLA